MQLNSYTLFATKIVYHSIKKNAYVSFYVKNEVTRCDIIHDVIPICVLCLFRNMQHGSKRLSSFFSSIVYIVIHNPLHMSFCDHLFPKSF